MNLKIDALAEFARRGPAEAELVLHELKFRKTNAAKKLEAALAGDVTDDRSAVAHEESPNAVEAELVARYESLRSTFTLEGEILARWGMTPDLPQDLVSATFESWRRRLSTQPDRRGRNILKLDEDLRALSAARSETEQLERRNTDGRR